ncbi:MAG TPA: MazG nucleotide pyrophosphohydrolase domain-containing protein [Planctomycetota bacterium]|nr:MazG nucleotide pyrophosphohydrolase domain-containing protein [Planctomycetota bacterium]
MPRKPKPRRRTPLTLPALQREIAKTFLKRDRRRGLMGTFGWFVEEVGELSTALREERPGSEAQAAEFADCLAWLASLANLCGVDLSRAVARKYAGGCSRCRRQPCRCRTKK